MRFFWPIYLLAGVVSTAVVYMAAPYARPYVGPLFPDSARSAASVDDVNTASAAVLKTVPSRGQPQVPFTPGKPEDFSLTLAPVEDDAPALLGIYLAERKERPEWGITHQQTAVFAPDGTRLRQVPGGTLLEYRAQRASSKGSMVECLLVQEDSLSPPRLVSQKDVFLFTGSYKRLSVRQLADLQAYYTLSGKIGLRKNELLQVSAAKNPFFAAYQAAHKKLLEHIDGSRALVAQRDSAVNVEKTNLEDRLREMKMEENRLRNAFNAEHTKFRAWKEQHASELPSFDNDASVQMWRQEMAKRRISIAGLAY